MIGYRDVCFYSVSLTVCFDYTIRACYCIFINLYSSANVVAGDIMFPECSCVRSCVSESRTSIVS